MGSQATKVLGRLPQSNLGGRSAGVDVGGVEETPEHLIGDKAYDSDPLDAELKVEGVEMIAPHRKNRKRRKTQDGRPLRRYARRWKVERFFAWLQWQRRIVTRWEYYPNNFLGFVQLASLLILFKRF